MSIQFRRMRHQAALTVTVQSEKWIGKATVMDLNEAGTRISGKCRLKTGQEVTIVAGDDRMTGIVRWVGEGRTGVSFVPQLSPDMVVKLRRGKKISKRLLPRYDSSNLREMR